MNGTRMDSFVIVAPKVEVDEVEPLPERIPTIDAAKLDRVGATTIFPRSDRHFSYLTHTDDVICVKYFTADTPVPTFTDGGSVSESMHSRRYLRQS